MLEKITVFLCSATLAFSANAFDPASKSISVVIPFAPGGGVDQTFRHFEKWAANKNIKLNPIYKPGAEGLVGMNEIASMPRDGYHISFGTAGTIAVQRIKNPSAELELITGIKNSITAFITHKDSGIIAIRDLEKVDNLTLAVGAPGQKMNMEQLLELSNGKIKGKLIPYKGGGPVVQDILGNHVKLGAVPLQIVKSQIDTGTIRLLAVGTRTRVSGFKDTPTIFELFPDWKDNDGFAVIMPKGSDPAAVKFWTALIKDYMDDKEVQRDFVKDFNEPMLFGKTELEKIVNNAVKALSKI
jgi:tripartite-type tricarboxylate transporter receptor subunit TctC